MREINFHCLWIVYVAQGSAGVISAVQARLSSHEVGGAQSLESSDGTRLWTEMLGSSIRCHLGGADRLLKRLERPSVLVSRLWLRREPLGEGVPGRL